MTEYIGEKVISGITKSTKYNAHTLLDFKWSDHILNDISWLRADTFSWQNGNTYTAVYNYLVNSIQGATTATSQGVTFYECSNGLRIALATQENNVLSAYNDDGVAWYYVLDTTNHRFKLPRTKYGFVGYRDETGKFVDEALPAHKHTRGTMNITGNMTAFSAWDLYSDGAFVKSSGSDARIRYDTASYPYITFNFDASRSWTGSTSNPDNATYQDGASVQQKSTQMYLYFYVGEFSQTAIEQTAGITVEQLNDKVDKASLTECQVVIETYISGTSGYRIWSDGYCEQWGFNSNTGGTVTLLKTMLNSSYCCVVAHNGSSAKGEGVVHAYNKTTTSFQYGLSINASGMYGMSWLVKGYLASGQY